MIEGKACELPAFKGSHVFKCGFAMTPFSSLSTHSSAEAVPF